MRIPGTPAVATPRTSTTPSAATDDGASGSVSRRLASDSFESAPKAIRKPPLKLLTPVVASAGEPTLAKLDDGTMPTYVAVAGQADAGGVHPQDVDQGDLGDCFFLSSLASLAQRQPQLLENAIHTNADGSYTVQLYQAQRDGSMKSVQVNVDDELPEEKGQPVYSDPTSNSELWVAIAEKAYAKLDKGYNVLNRGGAETDAMSALTGKPATSADVNPKSADAIFTQLTQAESEGKLTTAGTYSNADLKKALTQYQTAGTGSFDPKTFSYDKFGMVDDHAYTVMGTSVENGQKYVELRNPWGQTEPTADGDGSDDGQFKLPLAQFAQLFQEVSIGG